MICENCSLREGTENWAGLHSPLEIARNPYLLKKWCKRCALEFQIEYQEKICKGLSDLKKEYEELLKKNL